MSNLRRLVLIRHGETVGQSSIRFHGSSDIELSDEGRAQMREVARGLRTEVFDLIVASPLRRSWESARILSGGAPVRLEPDFREVDFGRWEGLTREEIEASDPVLYRDWQQKSPDFQFPGGEARAAFRARVDRGLGRLRDSGAANILVAAHKGLIRVATEALLGAPLDGDIPLGGAVALTRGANGQWYHGRRGSDPA
jgi:broad specificity phosphatase PhoE